ncbi:helix-hairpin-helix domain-containing protein [Halioglobus sp. Uisw_031]|jgi:DNA uptake protein ComE-like DNA-binding protein|uniref:helix-hairpin-helix domain-containing protein n=1 Tax=Halioglobus sp. Uisw_031 TaxID=3230977 RepID=UPI0039ED71BF
MAELNSEVCIGCHTAKNPAISLQALRLNTSMGGQKGVALAIVVWFIAGMSLLVAGIVSHARVDTQMAQLHVARAKAVAAADGAIQLMLAERLLAQVPAADEQSLLSGVYDLGNSEVLVMLFPAADLLDVNKAPQAALASLFVMLAQVPEGEANTLAENVVKWRATGGAFRETEDLLRVDGMNRTIFEAVRDFVAAQETDDAGADWEALLAAMLPVADQTNSGELNGLARRPEMPVGSNVDGRRPGNTLSLSGSYRADALVKYGDQTWLRRRWISVGAGVGSVLPWQTVRTEPPRVYERSNEVL